MSVQEDEVENANESDVTRTGGCLHGAVSYRVTGPMRPVAACQCRKSSGNYVAATSAPRGAWTISDDVRWFDSSAEARRGLCPVCGSQMFRDGKGANLSVMAGKLEGATGLALAGHIYCADTGDWYGIPAGARAVPDADAALTTVVFE